MHFYYICNIFLYEILEALIHFSMHPNIRLILSLIMFLLDFLGCQIMKVLIMHTYFPL
jgi:hypothetical protein